MKNFVDRQPTKLGRRKLTYEDGRSEFVTVEMADEPTREGTPLNREVMMALQGFEATDTVFLNDGSIVETNANGDTLKTTFPKGSIALETFKAADGGFSIAMLTYEEDGVIKTRLVDVME